jgi:hypothetical protein
MLTLKRTDIMALAAIPNIDTISIPSFSNEVLLHKGKMLGVYIPGHGVVLEPEYTRIQRFDAACGEGDIIMAGKIVGNEILCGAYSIKKASFVIPIEFRDNNPHGGFWEQLKLYRISEKQNAAT